MTTMPPPVTLLHGSCHSLLRPAAPRSCQVVVRSILRAQALVLLLPPVLGGGEVAADDAHAPLEEGRDL